MNLAAVAGDLVYTQGMSAVHTITVYGDFNCPFCYALNERLQVYGGDVQVEWRAVQHVPNVDSLAPSFEEQAQLTAEVASVRKRAPEVQIITPMSRPNTALACRMMAAAEAHAADRVHALRRIIYRALWQQGRDISDANEMDALLVQAGIEDLPGLSEAEETMVFWQQSWEEGGFDRRIPSMDNDAGGRILGFPAIPKLMPFLQGLVDDEQAMGVACEIRGQRKVMVLGGNVAMVQPVASEFAIEHAGFDADIEVLLLEAAQADLVVLDGSDERHKQLCLRLQAGELTQHIPVVVYNQTADAKQEVEAFNLGALDYMHGDQDTVVWLARSRGLARYKQSTDMLGKMARIDGLTEIPNRREFDRVLEIEWLRAIRSEEPLSLLLMDVDNFKAYNDGCGHDAGDECLRQVALAIQNSTRRGADFVARYGGEEFVCILPDTGRDGAVALANTLRENVQALNIPHNHCDGAGVVTISVGAATFNVSAQKSPVELIKAADTALYRAKEAGRNCVGAA